MDFTNRGIQQNLNQRVDLERSQSSQSSTSLLARRDGVVSFTGAPEQKDQHLHYLESSQRIGTHDLNPGPKIALEGDVTRTNEEHSPHLINQRKSSHPKSGSGEARGFRTDMSPSMSVIEMELGARSVPFIQHIQSPTSKLSNGWDPSPEDHQTSSADSVQDNIEMVSQPPTNSYRPTPSSISRKEIPNLVRSTKSLKEIKLVECHPRLRKSMQELPAYLYFLLLASCALTGNKAPTCVRGKWSHAENTLETYNQREACWVIGGTETKLRAARYTYGSEKQFLVVIAPPDVNFNDGKAAIIFSKNNVTDIKQDSSGRTRTPYFVWSPFASWRLARVERLIQPESQQPHDTNREGTESGKKMAKARTTLKHDVRPVDSGAQTWQQAQNATVIDTDNESDSPIARKRHRVSGNGQRETLPLQPKPQNRKASYATESRSHPDFRDGDGSFSKSSSEFIQSPSSTTALRTVPISATDSSESITFVFKKSMNDDSPRIKRWRECNNALKLSCQASVQGIKPNISPALMMEFGDGETECIMRNDEDDFQGFIEMVRGRYHGEQVTIIVLPITG